MFDDKKEINRDKSKQLVTAYAHYCGVSLCWEIIQNNCNFEKGFKEEMRIISPWKHEEYLHQHSKGINEYFNFFSIKKNILNFKDFVEYNLFINHTEKSRSIEQNLSLEHLKKIFRSIIKKKVAYELTQTPKNLFPDKSSLNEIYQPHIDRIFRLARTRFKRIQKRMNSDFDCQNKLLATHALHDLCLLKENHSSPNDWPIHERMSNNLDNPFGPGYGF